MMLCDDVKRFVYFFLDGSLADGRKHELELHLKACPDCEMRIVVQRRLRVFVRTRLSPVSAPSSLRARLSAAIRAAQ
jgi:mycothiol system anti-sigma-R factor